jgi:tetratricopeptide (TPR) repeat protein
VRPTHAYELKATLLRREEDPKFGVATELTLLPGGHTVFRTYWDDSWAHTLDRAASGVGAQVVPHSRHADTGPWCSWRGKPLSDDLFYAYQRAQRRWARRRYDEALEEYFAALRLDPVNEHLRNELGQAQEARALYLDALLTYHAAIKALEKRPSSGLDKAARLARARIEVLTQYRFTALIGFGERLARQWLPPPPNAPATRRSEELRQLRERLRPILRERYLDEAGRLIAGGDDLALLGLDGDGSEERLEELLSDTVERPRPHPPREGKVATPSKKEIEQARRRRRQARKRARAIR